MTVQTMNLHDTLLRGAEVFADRTALVDEAGGRYTYPQLLARVEALAAGLAARGLAKGQRVGMLAHNSGRFFELLLACARLGAVAYPVNWRLSADEVRLYLERAGPGALVVDEASRELLPGSVAAAVPEALRLQIDGTPAPDFMALERVPDAGAGAPPVEAGPDDPFAVIATAAVDVIPRGAVLTHGNLIAANVQHMIAVGFSEQEGNLVMLPLFHIAGLGSALAVLHAGGCNVVMPRFDAARAVALIDGEALTHFGSFPPMLASVLDAAKEAGSRLPSLRVVSGLDGPDAIGRLHAETGAEFHIGFGQTETSGFVTFQPAKARPGTAGRPGPLCRVRLRDDYGREVPAGTPGEIVVRGPVVFQGYDREPEATAHTLRDGWHHTGDVGRFDAEGFLYYVKRKPEKELIKPGGENVYPAEVEAVIMELDGVSGVCVYGVPDDTWGEAVKAVVETAAGLEAQQVIDHVGARIARFKRPKHVVFTTALPRDDTGAVDREAVQEAF